MKHKILSILFLITLTATGFSQKNGTIVMKNNVDQPTDFISGKRWKAVKYTKNNNPINLNKVDFAWFRTGGNYDCALLGIYDKGTWTFDKNKNQVTVSTTRSGPRTWDITEATATSLKVKSGVEIFEFVPDVTINETPSSESVKALLSKKWTIVDHKKNLIKINYKPNDFCRLFTDGTYDQSLFTFYAIGTWEVKDNGKTLVVTNGGSTTWQIVSITEDKLSLSKDGGKETLILVPEK